MGASLNGIMGTAVSGLQTSQTALRVVSDNVSNVDTPGYVRQVVNQQPLTAAGVGMGVTATITRAANQFLQAAQLRASGDSGRYGAVSDLLGQAQALFGDPSSQTSLFDKLDKAFAGFSAVASNTTAASRSQAVAQVQAFFSQAGQINTALAGIAAQADSRLADDVGKVNTLLSQIDELNREISKSAVEGRDTGMAENQQSQLVDQLSSLLDVRVQARQPGGVTVRASDGLLLAGDGAAKLSYDPTGPQGQISVVTTTGQTQSFMSRATGGELKGLLDVRNAELPDLQAQLSELTSRAADQLNAVSNRYSAVPAPQTLSGRNTGLDLATAIGGFTGKTNVVILNASGAPQTTVAIDFDAGAMTVNGAAGPAFTPATFLTQLNAALGGSGSASFSNGVLSLSASGSGAGVAVADDPTTPAQNSGRGFSGFFGLNDLVRSSTLSTYETGLRPTDPNGFTPGQTIGFRISAADGATVRELTVAVPPAGQPTMQDLLNALNDPATGVGLYGGFALDAAGQMRFTPISGSGLSLSVTNDGAQRGPNGPGMATLFGLDDRIRGQRASTFSVRSDIAANGALVPTAQLNLAAAPGQGALAPDDTRGADALFQASRSVLSFNAAGSASGTRLSISDYAAQLSAGVGRKAAGAADAKSGADAVAREAQQRRTASEGVNLDDELVQLTTYQQAYNASARLVQTVREMFDTLLGMTQ